MYLTVLKSSSQCGVITLSDIQKYFSNRNIVFEILDALNSKYIYY